MRAKETLQLRHQLSASGLSLRAATYDTKRHHVLTFDSHPLRPHVLRLFSLRRELKSVPLFDKSEGESTTKRPTSSNSSTQAHKRPSFFEQQLQQKEKRLNQSNVEVVVPIMLLQYSAKLDVFICVYSKATRPKGATQVPKITSHYVMLVEPGTLRILLIYEGPETNLLQCAHYDSLTDRVVLASYLKSEEGDGLMLPQAPKNVAEILQISKRLDDQDYWSTGSVDQEEPRMLLFIENTRASLRYPDKLAVICGSKGLRELYGASSDRSSSTDAVCTLLHWRQKQANVGKLMLVRRVLLRHRITAMVVSPCGDWLLAGFCDGSLKVWNVNGTRTNGSELFTIDAEPYEPPESSVTGSQDEEICSIESDGSLKVWNVNGTRTNESELFTIDAEPYEPPGSSVTGSQDEEICSIEVIASSTPNSTDAGSTDMVVIAAERDTGAVRHWKFSVERKIFAHGDDTSAGGHRYPRLRLVGYFNAGVKKQMGKEENPTKFKNQDTLGPALKTLVMCITIDMGSCFENLLLVVREDVIHVLKVQTVLYVMQEFAEVEEVYAVRGIIQQNENKVLSLSRTAVSKFRIFGLTDSSSETPSSKLLFAPPQISSTSVHVSLMETISNERMQLSFIVLTWSNGVVNVYDVLRENCVMQLEDKRLTDQISTLSVVTFSRTTPLNASVVREEDQFYTSRSSWSLAQGESSSSNACTDESDNLARRKLFIVVGTERGKLFGWSAGVLRSGDYTFQSVQKANVHVHAAHSSHIIQLAHVDTLIHGERALLASIGAGGIIKLWSIPSLKVVGHVNSIAEGYPATPSCLELLRREGPMKGRELYASVGYEDGRVAVWSVNFKQILFQRLDTSTRHERRVSKICRIPNDVVLTGLTEFLSCSLDMTVIQWQISGSGTVDEKRYFDIGAAIVDMILIQEHVVLALAHEVCKFEFAPSSGINIEYRIKPRTEIDGGEGDKDENEKQASIHADMQLIGDKYPDSPTTRSVEDPVSPSRRPSRSVDEYLTLHVPTAIHLEDTETSTDSAPATRDQNEDFVNSRTEDADKIPRHLQGSKSADKFQLSLINDDVLRGYLQEYIAHYGTGGTMAANRITHLLAIRPELPSVRRPGFALAKTLKILKLSAQDRLDPEEALYILRLLFAMPTVSNTSFDAPIMVHTLKEKNNRSEKAHAQRLREKKQALRKSVVTYNLLGEKCVRWEESLAEQEKCDQNQSQSSPISPCVGSIGNNNENIAGNVDEDDVVVLKEQSHVKMVHPVTKTTAKKSVRNKQVRSHNDCSGRMLENALMNSIRLSPMFQQFWTKGYCWCWPAPRLHITWTNEADNKSSENRSTKVRRRGKKCGACHKRLHTIELPRSGYTPHFSRQATFGIIVEVYSKLATIAHSRLYKSGSTKIERVPECSIFSAIYEVFLATYGMRNIVQMKLKLFFVSMCHYLSEYDAVAVFGELLGLHKSGIADEYDHAPSTLVALCVCCYSWLYSRGMVVNGDSFSGQLRGSEWGNSFNTTTTEVLPATDGTTHWQFVRVEHALLCAQDNLLYPLVNPGFLQSVMVYMQEYAQASPTRSLRTDSPDFGSDDIGRNGGNPVLWIELHRILRLLVGEWKHQNAHFRVTERLLFIYPQHDAALEGDLIEKLQLMLSCFVFYDHDRVGAMTITDFETLLFKFRYLWTEESSADEFDTAFNDMVFENTMSAIKKRFLDVSHDGQLCYLDFWAMLYIVGLKTRGLINFHEIPSFCRNYKLEVSPELSDMGFKLAKARWIRKLDGNIAAAWVVCMMVHYLRKNYSQGMKPKCSVCSSMDQFQQLDRLQALPHWIDSDRWKLSLVLMVLQANIPESL
ncbi:hypothetical protein PHMEG_0001315 [Phytophthora megakarya]|uniref:Uncharacterized protein n=1 Tax=Phytophthora megakarya TaxID=4795 RepID=A0A225X3D7_9STRA|nr:hypothetical protein PHMEG_0001315 [Phytophthora megakarya]